MGQTAWVAAAVVAAVAVLRPAELLVWAPWVAQTVVASATGVTVGRAYRWADRLGESKVSARPVREVDGPSLCAGLSAAPELSSPFVIRGALADALRNFSTDALRRPPLSDVVVDYFFDATRPRHLVPDARAPLGAVVSNITARRARHKVGSQHVISRRGCCASTEALRAALAALAPRCSVADVFGAWRFGAAALDLRLLTVPLFVSGGSPIATRTDLHSEPIGSVAVQLEGKRDWTLVPARDSAALRPAASPDGRAYFYSALGDDDLERVATRQRVTTFPGDALWVPPWTWHRVDYGRDGGPSVAASLFHFKPLAFLWSQPAFALAVLPNLAKELVGSKTQ